MELPSSSDSSRILSAVAPWLETQRWFPRSPGAINVSAAYFVNGKAGILAWLVVDAASCRFNVPVFLRQPAGAASPALGSLAQWEITDATADPYGQEALFLAVTGAMPSKLHCDVVHPLPAPTHAARLTSEQSNTSVVYDFPGGVQAILKVFRVYALGSNPDVELQRALDSTETVPHFYASARITESQGSADVAVVQEFLPGATDAWQAIQQHIATPSARTTPRSAWEGAIAELGRTTRRMHEALAAECGTETATQERQAELHRQWTARAHAAIAARPELADWEGTIATVYSATSHVTWPALQRIHGDYHLGQVIRIPSGDWRVLDFEGEPLRPLAERQRRDLALRDVAGMLRSFDYAAGAAQKSGGDPHYLAQWASRAQAAFLSGYGNLSGDHDILLEALLLDKALYEVAYEAAQRPAWIDIPLAGVRHIIERV